MKDVKSLIKDSGLRVTPQRLAVLSSIHELGNHPRAEEIIDFVHKVNPHIAIGTVYKTLETLVDKGLIRKVKTENDVMRYDGITKRHHHLYASNSDRIEDYHDTELDKLLENYFKKKNITSFRIEDVRLQIKGEFLKTNKCKEHEHTK